MGMLDYILEDNVFIDFGSEVQLGSDQMDISYPLRFATVDFQLIDTALLSEIADRIRIKEDFRPMHPMDGYTDETCDQNGWYDFYYGISDLPEDKANTCIEFIVVNSDSPDNEEVYTIDLADVERHAMYKRMDEQCRKYLGKGCDDLLAEARQKLEEEAIEGNQERRT